MSVDGTTATKPTTLVAADAAISLRGAARRFVSRGGEKLEAALDRFGVDPTGRCCLDVGASTGGFTDCLLQRGAARVVAVDVGYGQLAWALRQDPRVDVLERTNVRDLRPGVFPLAPELVVCDVSFISLRLVLPAIVGVATSAAELVLLVKPQFEADHGDVGSGGVVRDPSVWRRVLGATMETCADLGLGVLAVAPSPLLGPAGNVEFLLYGRRGARVGAVDLDLVLAEAEALRR